MLYHTDQNVLLGAPTGSGKTISAELAMLHLFNSQPDMKVYLLQRDPIMTPSILFPKVEWNASFMQLASCQTI